MITAKELKRETAKGRNMTREDIDNPKLTEEQLKEVEKQIELLNHEKQALLQLK